jgi:hypothetical protein
MQRIFFTTDMTNFKEQRICINFCFNLKKTAAETDRMLQEAFGDNAMSQSKTFHGTNASRTDRRLSTTMSVLNDHR